MDLTNFMAMDVVIQILVVVFSSIIVLTAIQLAKDVLVAAFKFFTNFFRPEIKVILDAELIEKLVDQKCSCKETSNKIEETTLELDAMPNATDFNQLP